MFYSAQTPKIVGSKVSAESIANGLRQTFDNVFSNNLPERDAALMDSMVFGRRELPDDISRNFTRTGTSHIVAASGFNISIIAFSAYFLMLWINRQSKVCNHRSHHHCIMLLVCCRFFAFSFKSIDHGRPHTWLSASWSKTFDSLRACNSRYNFCLQSILCGLPSQVFNFLLLRLFVYSLLPPTMFRLEVNKPWPYKILSAVLISICIQVITLPIIASSFHAFSPISPLANLVVIPLSAILTPIGALAAVAGAVVPFLGTVLCLHLLPIAGFPRQVHRDIGLTNLGFAFNRCHANNRLGSLLHLGWTWFVNDHRQPVCQAKACQGCHCISNHCNGCNLCWVCTCKLKL